MSVAKGDRSKTADNLETTKLLKGLCTYTIQITKNEKNFPKRDRWILTQHIVTEAVKAYTHAKKANRVNVQTMKDYKLRRKHQIKASLSLEALLALIEIAQDVLSLEQERVEYWEGYTDQCQQMLSAWRASDRKRYKAKLTKKDGEPDPEKKAEASKGR